MAWEEPRRVYLQIVHLEVDGAQAAAFEQALCQTRQRVFASPGFRGLEVAQDLERPGEYVVQVRWERQEDLAEHVDSGRFDRCWAPVRAHLASSIRVEFLLQRPALGLHGPGVVTDLSWIAD